MKLDGVVGFLLIGAVSAQFVTGALRSSTSKEHSVLTCRITMECSSSNHVVPREQIRPNHHYECSPILKHGELSDFSYNIDLPTNVVNDNAHDLVAGNLFLDIPGGRIVNGGVVYSNSSAITVRMANDSLQDSRRRMVATSGTRSILVLRVTAKDSTPSFTTPEIYDFIFGMSQPLDMPSLASQYSALSFGKLNFVPALGGVIDIFINMNANGAPTTSLRDAAIATVQSRFGVPSITALADHIMICLPPGTGNWAGVSSVNSWRVILNDQWCGYLSGLMHEMGHNLGLLHANQGGVAYMDFSSYMSAGYATVYYPLKSFNAANHWQLGWYSDRQATIDPSYGGRTIKIATFVDYGRGNKKTPVLLLVGKNTFLAYNRAKGFNTQTQMSIDQVVVVQQLDTGTSFLGGVDSTHPNVVISNFDGSGRDLMIYFCSRGLGRRNDPDWMIVSIGFDQNYCIVQPPTAKPTRRRVPRITPTLPPS